MIYYLVTKAHDYTIRSFLSTWGRPFRSCIRVLPYETLFRKMKLAPGTYIFSDIERLSCAQAECAARIAGAIQERWGQSALLNHPTRSMTRFELLRSLRREGMNDFNVYRLTDGEPPALFPVFVRSEGDHEGAQTGLIETPEALEKAVQELNAAGIDRRDKIITEYCDTSDARGIFRKYSCFCLAGEILPRHVCFSRRWMLKYPDLTDADTIREERDFVATNPHERELKKIVDLARIDYGRIDYSLKDGRIQVWEINTNPGLISFLSSENPARRQVHEMFLERLMLAVRRLDSVSGKERIINPLRQGFWGVQKTAKRLSFAALYALPVSAAAKARLHQRLMALRKNIFPEKRDEDIQ